MALVVVIASRTSVVGYDTSYALAWGHDLRRGAGLDFSQPLRPTPHPLPLLWGVVVSWLPVPARLVTTAVLALLAWVVCIVQVGRLTWRGSSSRPLAIGAAAVAASSAGLMLTTLDAHPDVWFLALCLSGLHSVANARERRGFACFTLAALIRPEGLGFALSTIAWMLRRQLVRPPLATSLGAPTAAVRTPSRRYLTAPAAIGAAGTTLVIACWVGMGVIGGQPSIAWRSAAENAQATGEATGIASVPGILVTGLTAGYGGFVTVATGALTAAALVLLRAGRIRRNSAGQGEDPDPAVAVGAGVAALLILDVAAFAAQGVAQTPLIPRYLLLASVLQVPLAFLAGDVLRRRITGTWHRSGGRSVATTALVIAGTLTTVSVPAIPRWQQVHEAMTVRSNVLDQAHDLVAQATEAGGRARADTSSGPATNACTAPPAVRSPALVPLLATWLDAPVKTVTVSTNGTTDGTGWLLQPRTSSAALLAAYGPYFDPTTQALLTTRWRVQAHTQDWLLLTTCASASANAAERL